MMDETGKLIREPHTVIFPLPIVLITSCFDGKETIDACAWVMPVNLEPPMIALAIRPKYLTYKYILETGEFAVNILSENSVDIVDYCVRANGYYEDKIRGSGLNFFKGKNIKCPLIKESIINLECKVSRHIRMDGTHDLFIAEILQTYYDISIVVDIMIEDLGKAISLKNAYPIAYMMGEYWSIGKFIGLRSPN